MSTPRRVYYDTEFFERGPLHPIKLISIGMVDEQGHEYYAVNSSIQPEAWHQINNELWLRENVLPSLPTKRYGSSPYYELDTHVATVKPRIQIREDVLAFCREGLEPGQRLELWAYYADYDHVVLSQLFGRMVDLPDPMPMFTHDLKQEASRLRFTGFPPQEEGTLHHALADAQWVRTAHQALLDFEKNTKETS